MKEKMDKIYIVYLRGNKEAVEILQNEEIGIVRSHSSEEYFDKVDKLICNYEKIEFEREIDLGSKTLRDLSEGLLIYSWGEPLYCIYLRKQGEGYVAYFIEEEFLRMKNKIIIKQELLEPGEALENSY